MLCPKWPKARRPIRRRSGRKSNDSYQLQYASFGSDNGSIVAFLHRLYRQIRQPLMLRFLGLKFPGPKAWQLMFDLQVPVASSIAQEPLVKIRFIVSDKTGALVTEPRLTPQRNCCAHAGLAGLGFHRLGSTALTSWFFMAGKRPSTSVRYSWGLMPRRRQL